MAINTGYQVPEKPDTLVTHRILADSENRLWIFFQTNYRSLAFGTSGDGGATWSPAREILPDVSGPFSATFGSGGSVHVVAKRSHPHDIHLLTWNGKTWFCLLQVNSWWQDIPWCWKTTNPCYMFCTPSDPIPPENGR